MQVKKPVIFDNPKQKKKKTNNKKTNSKANKQNKTTITTKTLRYTSKDNKVNFNLLECKIFPKKGIMSGPIKIAV